MCTHEISYTDGPDKIELCSPVTVAELISDLLGDMGNQKRCYVWRGQSNMIWEPFPGLYRRLRNAGYSDQEIDERLVVQYEEDLLCEAKGLGYCGQTEGDKLDFMVKLQHAGGATRLLDVTRDPFIALWFAVNGNASFPGFIYRYAIDCSCYAETEQIDNWDTVVNPMLKGRPLLFKPKGLNDRIKAQSSLFLSTVLASSLSEPSVFTNETPLIGVRPILIRAELKHELSDYLRYSRGLRAVDVFPDFEGYAKANSANAAFPRLMGDLYSEKDNGGYPPQYHVLQQ